MVKSRLLFTLAILFFGVSAFSQTHGIKLENWIQETYLGNEDYRYSLIVVDSDFDDSSLPVISNISSEEIKGLSYFKLVNLDSYSWDLKLNAPALKGLSTKAILEKTTSANFYLFKPQRGSVVFAKRNSSGRIEEMFSAKAKDSMSNEVLFSWIQKKLGWDGVVLAVDGNQFVVGAPASFLKEEAQALAISGSATSDVLDPGERKGSGLLGLVQIKGGFGLFESIFVDSSSTIRPGTKLIIEKKKK